MGASCRRAGRRRCRRAHAARRSCRAYRCAPDRPARRRRSGAPGRVRAARVSPAGPAVRRCARPGRCLLRPGRRSGRRTAAAAAGPDTAWPAAPAAALRSAARKTPATPCVRRRPARAFVPPAPIPPRPGPPGCPCRFRRTRGRRPSASGAGSYARRALHQAALRAWRCSCSPPNSSGSVAVPRR
ncbi:hypothetical protein D3C87_1552460 [compost metagenome]